MLPPPSFTEEWCDVIWTVSAKCNPLINRRSRFKLPLLGLWAMPYLPQGHHVRADPEPMVSWGMACFRIVPNVSQTKIATTSHWQTCSQWVIQLLLSGGSDAPLLHQRKRWPHSEFPHQTLRCCLCRCLGDVIKLPLPHYQPKSACWDILDTILHPKLYNPCIILRNLYFL